MSDTGDMKKATEFFVLVTAAAACGCLDLNLLDDMVPIDAGALDSEQKSESEEQSESANSGENSTGDPEGGDEDDSPVGPPDTDASDLEPPGIVPAACGAGESAVEQFCVAVGPASASIRFSTDEPAVVSLNSGAGGYCGLISEAWSTDHHGAVSDLVAETASKVTIGIEDVNGNRAEVDIEISGLDGPAVVITEVLADPYGTEPNQEFVEIVNIGGDEIDLGGWMIDDNADSNGDLIPDGAILGPGAVAVLVPAAYDPLEGQDPSPVQSCEIIYLESSIGSNGLKNSDAESIELYDATGSLVSQYRGQTGAPKEGCSAVRLAAELPDGDEWGWALDPSGRSSPGIAPTLR